MRWACAAVMAMSGCGAIPELAAHKPFPDGPCLHYAPVMARRPYSRGGPPRYYWLGRTVIAPWDDALRAVRADPVSAPAQRDADRHRLRFELAAAFTVVGGLGGAIGLGAAADKRGDPDLWLGAGVMAGVGVAALIVESVLLLPAVDAHQRAAVRIFNERAAARGHCPDGTP